MTEIGRYALIVGNSQYDDKALQQLVTPGQDIEALEDVLKDPAIGNFKVEVRRDIENRKLHSDIGQFLTEGRKPTDTLLLYFSCHGVVNDYSGQLYLAVRDSVRDRLGSTAIPTRFIYDCLQESPAGSKIIILDCCYSGAMTTVMLAKSPPKVTLAREFEGKGIVFLSASTAWQYAFQETDVKKLSENTLSLFTRFLVQGLKTGEADRDGDDVITIRELYDYILENVRKETSNQTPEISSIDQQGDIVIAKSTRSRSDDSLKKRQRHAMQGVKRQNQTLDSVEGTYQHALDHYRNKDWAEAEQWFSVVVKEDPDYKDAAFLLAEAKKQLKLKAIYGQGQQALEVKDWKTARDRLQEVLNIDPNYEKAQELHDIAHKEIELPSLYSLALEKCENREWDQAVKALQDIRNLDPRYRVEEISRLLDQARKKKKLDQDYKWALDQYEDAEKTGREEDWKKVVDLLEQIAHADLSYKTVALDVKLEYARRKARYLEFSRQIREHYAKQEWRRILERSRQSPDLVFQSALAAMVAEAKVKLKEQEMEKRQRTLHLWRRAIAIAWGTVGTIFAIAVAIFPDRFAQLGQGFASLLGDETPTPPVTATMLPEATPTPTIGIPGIGRIKMLMDGDPIDLTKAISLPSGKAVVLEVIVVDTSGKEYKSSDLACRWKVTPLDVKDEGINTDQCTTLYKPSQKYSSQTVGLVVEGLKQQFKPSDSISVEFSITRMNSQ